MTALCDVTRRENGGLVMTCDAWPYCVIGGWGESGLKLILIYFSMAKGKGETVFPSKLGNDLSTNLSGHAFLGEIE